MKTNRPLTDEEKKRIEEALAARADKKVGKNSAGANRVEKKNG